MLLFPAYTLLGQASLLEKKLTIEGGDYSAQELLEFINRSGISINFSGSLPSDTLYPLKGEFKVKDLLARIFDTDRYSFIQRNNKILIIPTVREKGFTFSGYIEEEGSRERLIGVNIYLPEYRLGTTTNEFGFFSMIVPEEKVTPVVISFIGYQRKLLVLNPEDTARHRDIALVPESRQLDEVTVEASRLLAQITQMSQISLSPAQLATAPAFMGEVDIIKSIQLLPGVQRGAEGNTNFLVRGGNPDQNLLLLDGVPVYNASHAFGFVSIFNADALKNVELTTGGFPARYGGRLSSVLEVNMKEGNMEKIHGAGSIGLITSKLMLEGPIKKEKTSFMISGRRTYWDVLLKPVLAQSDNDISYYFGDINFKVNHKFSRKDRIYLSLYTGRDKLFTLSPGSELDFKWGNYTSVLRWNHLYSDKLFGNLSAIFSQYRLSFKYQYPLAGTEGVNAAFKSLIQDYGLRYDFDYTLNPRHHLRTGVSATYHVFKPGFLSLTAPSAVLDSIIQFTPTVYATDVFVYAEDDWQINERWKLNYGLHLSSYFTSTRDFTSLQPRLAARYLINQNWSLKASYAYMKQFVHLLANTGTSLPTDLWVSSSRRVPPQNSHQVAMGTAYATEGSAWEYTAELYYKYYTDLITYRDNATGAFLNNWENQVLSGGIGRSYGLELLARKTKGKTTGWIGYTLSWSERRFERINQGEWFPFKYDRRHDFKMTVNHQFTKKFGVSANWVYNTGQKATIPLSSYIDAYGQTVIHYSKRNAFTYPAYHRLDLAVNWFKKTKWGERTWSIGVYNAYNRINPYYIYFSTDELNQRVATQVGVFPILPSISYNFRF